MSRHCIAKILMATLLCGCQSATAQSNDPPSRVGRVSNVTGSVSLMLAGDTQWRNASLNYPLTTADALWTDVGARTEINVGAAEIHLAGETSLSLDAVQDNLIQLRVGQGALHIRLRAIIQDESYEIDTPAGAILLRDVGDYRIDVTPDGQRTTFTVRDGRADVRLDNNSYAVPQGTSVTLTVSSSQPMANDQVMPMDDWERWADTRNRRGDDAASTRYVPREMIGYDDLDQYGDWQVDAAYGPMWYPRSVSADWAPYRSGRWESVEPWGWTWIDDAPWGFAPFHYGRWSNRGGRWGWSPGSMAARPVYAPALVAFVSGSNWSASLSFGSNGGVGWVPLGPQEVYVPSYRASPTYMRNVNITNVNVTNINVTNINVNNVQYINRSIPGAVTAVPRDVFMGSRQVSQAAVRVRPTDLVSARVSVAPIADNAPVAPPARGSAMDRARPDNAGTIRQPPVALKRSPNPPAVGRGQAAPQSRPLPTPGSPTPPPPPDRGRGQAGQQPPVPPTAIPAPPPAPDQVRKRPDQPATPDRGRGRAGQPQPVSPPTAIPAPPPAPDQVRKRPDQPAPVPPPATPDRGRGRAGQPQPVTPPVAIPAQPPTPDQVRKRPDQPTPVPPPATPDRGRGRAGQPQPVNPPTAIPTPPPAPDQSRKRPDQPAPVPPPATPDRGRGRTQPTPMPAPTPRQNPPAPAPKPDVPPPPPAPVTPQGGGRGTPTQPANPVGRGRTTPPDSGRGGKPTKPAKTKPDTGRGGGAPSIHLEYQM